jgi:uncharacterized LabA/DUF88 family protein
VVFLDYQNVYRGARRMYGHDYDSHCQGQIDPLKLAQHLADDSPYDRALTQVRIYRGQPDSTRDPKGYGASRRQHTTWTQFDKVHLVTRPLRYPDGWPRPTEPGAKPQEKGIDVALALDFVAMAIRREYEVGILMSTDTDLKPALELVAQMTAGPGTPRAEVAAWSAEGSHSPRLSIPGRRLYCHWISEATYRTVADTTDYAAS